MMPPLSPLLLAVVLKGAVVLALAALAAWVLRRAPASARHGVWATAFGALLLLPILEAVGPSWSVSIVPASVQRLVAPAPSAPPAPPAPPLPALAPPAPPAPPVPPSPAPSVAALAAAEVEAQGAVFDEEMAAFEVEMADFKVEIETFASETETFGREMEEAEWASGASAFEVATPYPDRSASRMPWTTPLLWGAALWAVGAVVVALGWLSAFLSASRLVREAEPETDAEWGVLAERARRLSGLPEFVRLLRSERLDVPVAWGFGRPAVVLPASADTWTDDRREAVLLHEMAHLRRRDAWTQAVAQAALAVHWLNPLAWLAYRRFLDAREQACDDAVIQGGARPSAYAEHLVGVARGLRRDPLALAAVAPMARCAPLEGRVRSILDAGRRRGRLGRPALGGTVGLALLVVVPLAAFQPVERAIEAPAPFEVVAPAVADTLDEWDEVEAAVAEADAAVGAIDMEAIDMENAEADIEAAREDIRRTLDALDRQDGPKARLRAEALRAADEALATMDLRTVRADAQRVAHESANRDIEAARADIRRTLAEVRRETGPEAQLRAYALRSADAALATLDLDALWDDAEDARRRALREADHARRDAQRRLRDAVPPPTVTPPAPPAPRPAPRPTPRPDVRPGRSASFDWNAIDRARRDAVRNAPPCPDLSC